MKKIAAESKRLVCYGRFFDRLEWCKTCQHREYCRTGGDPPLMADRAAPFDSGVLCPHRRKSAAVIAVIPTMKCWICWGS